MPKTRSKLTLSQRREAAYEKFARGYTNVEVAKELKINKDTAASYRKQYESRIHAQAASNPNFLKDVITNTVRSLEELDRIRADAWKHMEDRSVRITHECPECEHSWKEIVAYPISDQTRAKYHNVLLKAQDQRSKLFGILGVKQEVFVAIMLVKTVQDKILEFMADRLCERDREALAQFLETPEMAQYTGGADAVLGAIDASSTELVRAAS